MSFKKISPVRSMTYNGYKMNAWFDILGVSFGTKEDEEGIKKASKFGNKCIDLYPKKIRFILLNYILSNESSSRRNKEWNTE